jgi:hypothetical protein
VRNETSPWCHVHCTQCGNGILTPAGRRIAQIAVDYFMATHRGHRGLTLSTTPIEGVQETP